MRRCWNREEVQESQGPRIPRPRGPKDQDISNSHSNTSLTLKKVHLVSIVKLGSISNDNFVTQVPGSQGPRYLKVTFKYELDSKEGPSCFTLSFHKLTFILMQHWLVYVCL